MQFNRLIVLAIAGVLGLSCSAHGLEWRIVVSSETSDEQRRVARQKYLDELIGSIQKTCHLTEAEVRRLQVASKGAVEYSFTDELNANENRSGRRVNVLRVEIRQGQRHVVTSLDAAAAARHTIWARTLERTLTGEQLEKANILAKQQLDRWTQRIAPQPVILQGLKRVAPIRGRRARLPIIREMQPIEIEKVRRLDLIAEPLPRNR